MKDLVPGMVEVRRITFQETAPLRQAVLRPHQALSEMAYAGDQDASTIHGGLFCENKLSGIASLYEEGRPGAETAWRLRGMAIDPAHQGKGFGRQLLAFLLSEARCDGAKAVWCNARASAIKFSLRMGFLQVSDVFEIVDLGPHVLMQIEL